MTRSFILLLIMIALGLRSMWLNKFLNVVCGQRACNRQSDNHGRAKKEQPNVRHPLILLTFFTEPPNQPTAAAEAGSSKYVYDQKNRKHDPLLAEKAGVIKKKRVGQTYGEQQSRDLGRHAAGRMERQHRLRLLDRPGRRNSLLVTPAALTASAP